MNIIYLHGYGSSGQSSTVELLRKSRYSVDDSVDIEGEEFDYICFIPEEFLS